MKIMWIYGIPMKLVSAQNYNIIRSNWSLSWNGPLQRSLQLPIPLTMTSTKMTTDDRQLMIALWAWNQISQKIILFRWLVKTDIWCWQLCDLTLFPSRTKWPFYVSFSLQEVTALSEHVSALKIYWAGAQRH